MPEPDYDDPDVEEQWCAEMREQVSRYLSAEQLAHGQIGDWPAWHVAPVVSIWAIESSTKPGWVGMWIICGDLPTDYVSADAIKHPRAALQAFADRWRKYATAIREGASPTDTDIEIHGVRESPEEMIPMLESRTATLVKWAADDSMWEGL